MSNFNRRKIALEILNSGLNIWDSFKSSSSVEHVKIALREKTRAICNHDRCINGEHWRMK